MIKTIYTVLLAFAGYALQPVELWRWMTRPVPVIYYVSSSTGSDAASGLEGAPWQTIAKVKSVSFGPGDIIKFKAGDSWNERLDVPTSGTAGNVITYTSYGVGAKPVITGFQSKTLTHQGSNIWTGTLDNSVARQNTVLINGAFRAKGRYPDATNLTAAPSGNTQTRVIINALTGTPNYAGGELFTRGYNWINDVIKIQSQSVDTLFLQLPTTYLLNNYSCYIQNLPSLCNAQNEWAYDSASKLFTGYFTTAPTILYSSIDTLINLKKKDYITFDGLHITGANAVGICMDSLNNVIINNCVIDYTGGSNPEPATKSGLAGAGIRGKKASKITISNDSILNNLNNGIFIIHEGFASGSDSNIIEDNYIYNTSMISGLGAGGNGAGIGIDYGGNATRIRRNKVINTGYCPVYFSGTNDTIYRNYVDSFATVKEDCGGIYTSAGAPGSVIRANIVRNGIGIVFIAAGIYLDDNSYGITVDSNTTINTRYFGFFTHVTNKITATDNTIITGAGIAFGTEGSSSSGGPGPSYYYRNIFYAQSASHLVMQYGYQVPATNYNADTNYYLRPISETNKIRNAFTNTFYSTATAWSAVYGKDVNSFDMPTGVIADSVKIYYNPTMVDSTVYFSGRYKDAPGNIYTNSVVIPAFKSKLLFKTIVQPTTPKNRVGNLIFY